MSDAKCHLDSSSPITVLGIFKLHLPTRFQKRETLEFQNELMPPEANPQSTILRWEDLGNLGQEEMALDLTQANMKDHESI